MGRLPYQVLVIPYVKEKCNIKYCIFERRKPQGQIQFIAGGGEDEETPLQAAIRETREESGIQYAVFQPLTSLCHIPTNIFSDAQRRAWGMDVVVIPEYSFAAAVTSYDMQLSDEHVGFRWVAYAEALPLLRWDSNRTALFELHCRLTMCQKDELG